MRHGPEQGFGNVTGGERHQTERDFDAAEQTRDIKASRRKRFRDHLIVDTDDSTVIVFADGCAAFVYPTEVRAKEQLDQLQADSPDRYDGARLVAGYTRWDHHILRYWRRDDDSEIPSPLHSGCPVDHWGVR